MLGGREVRAPLQERMDPLPKTLPGTVCRQSRRCGKPNCRCADGELHGPYFYRFWREGRKLRKEYIRPERLAEVMKRCTQRQKQQREKQQSWRKWQRTVRLLRQLEQITKEEACLYLLARKP